MKLQVSQFPLPVFQDELVFDHDHVHHMLGNLIFHLIVAYCEVLALQRPAQSLLVCHIVIDFIEIFNYAAEFGVALAH